MRQAQLKRLVAAWKAYRSDYRTEGCPDPTCRVCAASKAAERDMIEAMKEVEEAANA
jgi:hypothetical protein